MLLEQNESPDLKWLKLQDIIGCVGMVQGGWGWLGHHLNSANWPSEKGQEVTLEQTPVAGHLQTWRLFLAVYPPWWKEMVSVVSCHFPLKQLSSASLSTIEGKQQQKQNQRIVWASLGVIGKNLSLTRASWLPDKPFPMVCGGRSRVICHRSFQNSGSLGNRQEGAG